MRARTVGRTRKRERERRGRKSGVAEAFIRSFIGLARCRRPLHNQLHFT